MQLRNVILMYSASVWVLRLALLFSRNREFYLQCSLEMIADRVIYQLRSDGIEARNGGIMVATKNRCLWVCREPLPMTEF